MFIAEIGRSELIYPQIDVAGDYYPQLCEKTWLSEALWYTHFCLRVL